MPSLLTMISYHQVMPEDNAKGVAATPPGPNDLRAPFDQVDQRILAELAVDARIPNNLLAERAM